MNDDSSAATSDDGDGAPSKDARSPKHTVPEKDTPEKDMPEKDTVSLSKDTASANGTVSTTDTASANGTASTDTASARDAAAAAGDVPGGRRSGPRRAGTFIYPLPSTPLPSSTPMTSTAPITGTAPTTNGTAKSVGDHALDRTSAAGVGVGTTNEGTSPMTSTSTNGTPATGITANSATDVLGSGAPSRRTSMGVASVRIAARLAQGELATRTSRAAGTHSDPTVDSDELLQLLGEYLLAGGLEKPEIHATLGGQPIVVDLQSPGRFTR